MDIDNLKKARVVEEEEFLQQYRGEVYEKPSVAVDLIILTVKDEALKVFLVKRHSHPFKGKLCLPGVFVRIDETLEEASLRALHSKARLADIYLEQLYTWGAVERDPRMRIISVSYMALVPWEQLSVTDLQGNAEQYLFDVDEILADNKELAFDHREIIAYAKDRVKNKVEYSDVAFAFLPETFTLPRLQKIFEILLGKELYKANFRKRVQNLVDETGEMETGGPHRPSKIYRKKGGSI